jgi:hypothetical protein
LRKEKNRGKNRQERKFARAAFLPQIVKAFDD